MTHQAGRDKEKWRGSWWKAKGVVFLHISFQNSIHIPVINMKRIALCVACLACCLALHAEVTAEEAIEVLSTSVSKFSEAKGLSLKMGIKVPIAPAMEIEMFSKGDLFAMAIDGGKAFFRDDIIWEYDEKENTVEIQKMEKSELKDLALLAALPAQMELKDLKPLSKNTFQVGENTVKFEEKDGKITYHFKSDEGNMDMVVNAKSKNISQLKMKKGVMALTISYSNIKYTCADKDVLFDAANFPGVKIIDQTK